MLKQKIDAFLEGLVSDREAAKQEAVAEAIASKHLPYVEDVKAALSDVEKKANEDFEAAVERLRAELNAKIEKSRQAASDAIDANRKAVVEEAEKKAIDLYDRFILGASKLTDELNIKN